MGMLTLTLLALERESTKAMTSRVSSRYRLVRPYRAETRTHLVKFPPPKNPYTGLLRLHTISTTV